MKKSDFNTLVEDRFVACNETLISKDKEYSSDEDRLHNFKRAGRMRDKDPIDALDGMWLKHLVSIQDMVDKMIADPNYVPSREMIKEKLGDNINYTLLLEGLIEDRREALGKPAAEVVEVVEDALVETQEHCPQCYSIAVNEMNRSDRQCKDCGWRWNTFLKKTADEAGVIVYSKEED